MYIDATKIFSALSHETRLRCLTLLTRHEELCVCEITHAIGEAQPQISRSLGQLRQVGLVSDRREGLWIHYRINPDLPDWVKQILQITTGNVQDQSPYIDDETTLASMPNRPGAPRCA
jgi:ArsR family transcriptional regulator